MRNWKEVTAQVCDLVPYEHNPRIISEEAYAQLKRSIEEDGFHQRILAYQPSDGSLLQVIGGHQRIKVLKELGIETIPVLVPDQLLTPQEFDRLNIRDNIQAGTWDYEMLANRFDPAELKDWGLEIDLGGEDAEEEKTPEIPGEEVATAVVVACKDAKHQKSVLAQLREDGFTAYAAEGSVKIKH